MKSQALEIASWGDNVYVKIPVTNTSGETCYSLVDQLTQDGVKVNVTALMTLEQVTEVSKYLKRMFQVMFQFLLEELQILV